MSDQTKSEEMIKEVKELEKALHEGKISLKQFEEKLGEILG
jgi:predicted RNA-binding protein associated with RNAse of E/G family